MNENTNLLIVIATYNEIDNLPRLVAQLEGLFPTAHILVIDDASPDGTGHWCDEASQLHPRMSVVHRERKSGLGSAAVVGFQKAMARNIPLVATMDADFSHDPATLVDLVAALMKPENASIGVAIGSRYISGGSVSGWPLGRRIASRLTNLYSRTMLGLKTKDNTGAFRVYRCDALKKVDLGSIRSHGYGYLEEVLWRLRRCGVEMIELPIVFRNRERGKSKTSISAGLKVVGQITKMGLGWWK